MKKSSVTRLLLIIIMSLSVVPLTLLIHPLTSSASDTGISSTIWTPAVETPRHLYGIWGSSSSNIFAVGQAGTILRYNGSSWNSMTSSTTSTLKGIWGSSSSNVFAVGSHGTILNFDGSTWNAKISNTASDLNAVWGSSSSDIFAVGSNGIILHYNGVGWSSMSSYTTVSFCGVWGSSSNNVFVVGEHIILHYDGASWSTVYTSSYLYGFGNIWGNSASDIFAVGSYGFILHYDGNSWTQMSSGYNNIVFSGIWGTSSDSVFTVGNLGTILHYNGNVWSTMSSGTIMPLNAVWGSSATDVFAVGSYGTTTHYNGSVWTASPQQVWNAADSTSGQRKIVKDSQGNLHVVYHRKDNLGILQIYHAQSSDGGITWAEEPVTSSSSNQINPSLAIDSHDNLHLVWQNGSTGLPNQGNVQVLYKMKTTTWGNTELVSDYAATPSIAVDGLDNIHVAYGTYSNLGSWSDFGYGIRWREKTQAGWQGEVSISNSKAWVRVPSIAIDGNNNVHVVWINTPNQYYDVHYIERTSSGWGSEISISQNSYSGAPSIAIDSANNVHIVWRESVNGQNYIRYREITGTLQPTIDLEGPTPYLQDTPTVSVDNQNHVNVLWSGLSDTSPFLQQIRSRTCTSSWQPVVEITSSPTNDQNYPNSMWSFYPIINGIKTNVPQDGYAFIWMDWTMIKYYSSGSVTPVVPGDRGLRVTVIAASSSYYIGDTAQFDVIIRNDTDKTGINVTAKNVRARVVPPAEIDVPFPTFYPGDLGPGESVTWTFSATMKQAGDNVELVVEAWGWDDVLGKPIDGRGLCHVFIADPSKPPPDWSFAVITDLHIGYGQKVVTDEDGFPKIDYDGDGWENDYTDSPIAENDVPAQQLESTVATIIDRIDVEHIKFVMVLGDISDTAEWSEFCTARKILNRLNDPNGDGDTGDGIPYIPIMGNHDIWPYTQNGDNSNERAECAEVADRGAGDKFFKDVFWGDDNSVNKDMIEHRLQNWEYDDATFQLENYYFWPLSENGDKYFNPSGIFDKIHDHVYYDVHVQNYGFTYDGITFLCLDQVPRNPDDLNPTAGDPLPGSSGGSWATDHNCSENFARSYFKDHHSDTVALFSHYLLGGDGVVNYLWSLGTNLPTKAYVFAGHWHINAALETYCLGMDVHQVLTEDVGRVPLPTAQLAQRADTLAQIGITVQDYNDEVIRIVSKSGDELDYSTTLSPGRFIDILWPSPYITHTGWASYPEPNEPITFTAHYTTYHGFETTYDWDFGDGAYDTGSPVVHTYSQDGDYNVTLAVTTKNLMTGELTTLSTSQSIPIRRKHLITGLSAGLNATSLISGEDLTVVAKNIYEPALISTGNSDVAPVGVIGLHFDEAMQDIDLSGLVADVNLADGKSVFYRSSWPAEAELYKLLYIPSTGAGAVYICLGATSLAEVSQSNADLVINVGETKDGITVDTTFYNGREYYVVSGVTGTGGGEAISQSSQSVPAVSTWGAIALAIALGGCAIWARRRRTDGSN